MRTKTVAGARQDAKLKARAGAQPGAQPETRGRTHGDPRGGAYGGPQAQTHGAARAKAPPAGAGERAKMGAPARNNILKIAVIAVDLLLVNASYLIGFSIRFSGAPPLANLKPFVAAIPLLTLSSLVYVDIFGLLQFFRKSRRAIISSIFKLVFMQALTTTSITYFLGGFAFPRTILLLAPAIQVVLLAAWNWAMLSLRDAFTGRASVMLVGGAEAAGDVLEKLARSRLRDRMGVRHVLGPDEKAAIMEAIPATDEVILCPQLPEALKMEIMVQCMNSGKAVYLVPEVSEIALLQSRVIHLDDMPVFMPGALNLSFEQRFFKRAFDLAAAAVALPLLLPLFAATAAAVRLTSPGKALYRQERMTAGGRIYQIYKFRTMREGAESGTGPVKSAEGDSRVTKVGGFLRRYHIDELPQLVNVLKGDMSLVGPRSERPYFVEQYSRDIEGYGIRNNVKAGLTGYAQIYGHYATLPEYKLKYDILYIKNYSLLLDIKLLLQTVSTVLRKGGA